MTDELVRIRVNDLPIEEALSGTPRPLIVDRDGTVLVQGPEYLIGTITPTPWTNVVFENDWANDTTNGFTETKYRRFGDVVSVRGRIADGIDAQPAFTLAVGFWPPNHLEFPVAAPVPRAGRVDGIRDAYAQLSSTGVFSTFVGGQAPDVYPISFLFQFSVTP